MSNTYLSEGNQIVLKERFRNILANFELDYFATDTDIFEEYSNKLLELFNKTIADLEAKLAESEEQLKEELVEKKERIKWLVEAEWNRKWANKYIEMRRKEDPKLLFPDSDEVYERYFELKQQLEEKEQEIENEIKAHHYTIQDMEFLNKKHNQDKIEFAIAELEKVKEKFGYKYNSQLMVSSKGLCDYIDQQIKELRGEYNEHCKNQK